MTAIPQVRSGPKNIATAKGNQTISPKDSVICLTPEEADKKLIEIRKTLGDVVTVRRFGLCVNVYK